ncbi:MAG: hypothetical protein ACK476_12305 [Fluviicola sp.]
MNRIFLGLLCLLLVSFNAQADLNPEYTVSNSTKNPKLKGKSVTYTFTFSRQVYPNGKADSIIYQMDGNGKNKKVKLKNDKFVVKTTAGKHSFVVWYSGYFKEVSTSKIEAKAMHNVNVVIYLQDIEEQHTVDKPVIYLYPEKEQAVSVELKPTGKLTFTYPKYDQKWEVTANPNGKIKHGNQTYNYLFWEAEQHIEQSEQLFSEGFVVNGSNSLEFLDEQLTAFGFTREEKADFITFWGPRMTADKEWFVHFVVNEDCQQFADVQFEPKPDHFYRFYILLAPLEEVKNQLKSEPKTQVFEPMKREGFVAFEWGGSVLSTKNL